MIGAPSLARWLERRTFGPEDVPTLAGMRARKFATATRVTIAIPLAGSVSGEAGDLREMCRTIMRDVVEDAGLADRLIVATHRTDDATAHEAADEGAGIVAAPGRGRGDALRAAVAATGDDVVVWVDGTTRNFTPRIVARLLAPLLLDQDVAFVKGFTPAISPKSGGRASDRLARPLLAAHFPDLAGFTQPLLREGAARGSLLRSLAIEPGDGVEAGLLIDAWRAAGLDAMGRSDLGGPVLRTRPVSRDDAAAAAAIVRRAEETGPGWAFADAPTRPLLAPLSR